MAKFAVLLTERQMQLIELAIRIAVEDGSIYGANDRDAEIALELEAIDAALSNAKKS